MAWEFKPRHFDFENGKELRPPFSVNNYATKWASSTRGSIKKLQSYKNKSGAASLLDMCWRTVLVNLPGLDAESLRTVPWSIGERLWKIIRKNDLISVSTWKAFVVAYHDDVLIEHPQDMIFHSTTPRIMSYALQSQANPDYEGLPPYIDYIIAPAFEWINLMSIVDAKLTRQDWIALAKIANLGVLFVQNSYMQSGCIDNTVVKAWSNAAKETGAFSSLKVVLLRNQSQITIDVLEYLSYLPALKVLHLTGPNYESRTSQEIIRGSQWIWMDQYLRIRRHKINDRVTDINRSRLCLKLFAAWHSRHSMSTRLKNMYEAVDRHDGDANTQQVKPMLNIMSGPDPSSVGVGRQEQLWLELEHVTTKKGHDIAKQAPGKRLEEVAQATSKKRKMREGTQRSMTDLFGEFMTTPGA